MRKLLTLILAVISLITLTCCQGDQAVDFPPSPTAAESSPSAPTAQPAVPTPEPTPTPRVLIDPSGMTTESRILPPDGYTRTAEEPGSLAAFLREYPLKTDSSPVLLYDGREKGLQSAHQAVFTLPIDNVDLQQCADSVMRVYAEYLYHSGRGDEIAFHFTSGFLCEWSMWQEGWRVRVDGNDVSYVHSAGQDDSYECFQKYLRIVFSYAGTLSMTTESYEIPLSDLRVGDVFLKGGSPGHVVMVVDVCVNEAGEKAFLLAQGYMPAQEFHVLKNPRHDDDPWYYEDEVTYPFSTAQYTFPEGSLRRLSYLQ